MLALWARLLLWPARRKKVDWHIPLWVFVIPLGWGLWALVLETLGLWCSTVLFVGLIMLVHPQRKIRQVLWGALGISTVMTLFFVYGLDVSVPVWPMLLREALP